MWAAGVSALQPSHMFTHRHSTTSYMAQAYTVHTHTRPGMDAHTDTHLWCDPQGVTWGHTDFLYQWKSVKWRMKRDVVFVVNGYREKWKYRKYTDKQITLMGNRWQPKSSSEHTVCTPIRSALLSSNSWLKSNSPYLCVFMSQQKQGSTSKKKSKNTEK